MLLLLLLYLLPPLSSLLLLLLLLLLLESSSAQPEQQLVHRTLSSVPFRFVAVRRRGALSIACSTQSNPIVLGLLNLAPFTAASGAGWRQLGRWRRCSPHCALQRQIVRVRRGGWFRCPSRVGRGRLMSSIIDCD